MWDYTATTMSLWEAALLLRKYLLGRFITREEHEKELQRTRQAHASDLAYVRARQDKELYKALLAKRRELKLAQGTLDRATRALRRCHPNH